MEGEWSLWRWPVKGRANGYVTEMASLMEGEWSCYSLASIMEGAWLCYRGGQFN